MDLAVRRASARITLVSPTLEKNMKTFAKDKVTTIPNGIELPEIREKSDSGKVECIAIGRIEKEKGIHYAIRAIANLSPEQRNSGAKYCWRGCLPRGIKAARGTVKHW